MIRINARLDIKGPNLVKGVSLEGLRVLGTPQEFARRYYEQGADAIFYMDTVASLYGRNNLVEIVQQTAKEIFIPLNVGGGVRSLEDIYTLLRAGADKVAINTAAIHHSELLKEGIMHFGSQSIVLSVEAKQRAPGKYECLTDNGRQRTGVDVFEWVAKAEDLGVGEILLTSVDQDGTGRGFDLELIRRVTERVSIPVIASGGAGCMAHVRQAIEEGGADAVACASLFHYEVAKKAWQCIHPTDIGQLKAHLAEKGIPCRGV